MKRSTITVIVFSGLSAICLVLILLLSLRSM